jgi:CPA2 family monovalent cation:H+ antiporter-2
LLYKAGADTVITEEFETSLEMIRRILGRLGYRPAVIDREVLNIRQQRYERFRGSIEKIPLVSEAEFEPFEVEVRSKSSGKTVAELAIREHTGSTIVAIRRHDSMIPNPAASEILQEGDHVYLIGNEEQIRRAMRLL